VANSSWYRLYGDLRPTTRETKNYDYGLRRLATCSQLSASARTCNSIQSLQMCLLREVRKDTSPGLPLNLVGRRGTPCWSKVMLMGRGVAHGVRRLERALLGSKMPSSSFPSFSVSSEGATATFHIQAGYSIMLCSRRSSNVIGEHEKRNVADKLLTLRKPGIVVFCLPRRPRSLCPTARRHRPDHPPSRSFCK